MSRCNDKNNREWLIVEIQTVAEVDSDAEMILESDLHVWDAMFSWFNKEMIDTTSDDINWKGGWIEMAKIQIRERTEKVDCEQ